MAQYSLKQLPSAIILVISVITFQVASQESQFCGQRPLFPTPTTNRIQGGVNARPGEFPWHVFIQNSTISDDVVCGASIIYNGWILTAAHCFEDSRPEDIKRDFRVVASGIRHPNVTWNANANGSGQVQVKRIKNFWIHELYKSDTADRDIAVVELTSDFRIDNFTRTICLPSTTDNFVGRLCTVSGFGKSTPSLDSYSMELKKVDLPVINSSLCEVLTNYTDFNKTICTSSTLFPSGRRGSGCNGDSGGSLACVSDNGQFVLAGVTSWGQDYCQGPATVFMDVAAFRPWINRKLTRTVTDTWS